MMKQKTGLHHSLDESNSILACIIGCNIAGVANLFRCADSFNVDLEYAIKQIPKSKLSYKRIVKQIAKESFLAFIWEIDYHQVRELKNLLDSKDKRVLKITFDQLGKYNIVLRIGDREQVVNCQNDIIEFLKSLLGKSNEAKNER